MADNENSSPDDIMSGYFGELLGDIKDLVDKKDQSHSVAESNQEPVLEKHLEPTSEHYQEQPSPVINSKAVESSVAKEGIAPKKTAATASKQLATKHASGSSARVAAMDTEKPSASDSSLSSNSEKVTSRSKPFTEPKSSLFQSGRQSQLRARNVAQPKSKNIESETAPRVQPKTQPATLSQFASASELDDEVRKAKLQKLFEKPALTVKAETKPQDVTTEAKTLVDKPDLKTKPTVEAVKVADTKTAVEVHTKVKTQTTAKTRARVETTKVDEVPQPLKAAKVVEARTPAIKTEVTEQLTETSSVELSQGEQLAWMENGRPQWAQSRFDVLLFSVSGLKLAVPLIALGQIIPLSDELTPIFGQAEWMMGILPTPLGKIKTVNTAMFVMPERYKTDFLDTARYVISINELSWGLAVDEVYQPIQIEPEDVKWRTHRTQRAWLAGTVKDHMCALIDVPMMGQLLEAEDHKKVR